MADPDLREELVALRAAMDEIDQKFKKKFGDCNDDKDKMGADDMIQQQFAEDDGEADGEADVHIDIQSHDGEEEEEEKIFPASRYSRPNHDVIAMRRENSRMSRELQTMRNELSHEKFSRELDSMESEGYRIPADRRPRLIAELARSRNPSDLIDTWRDLFARDPIGIRIDMGRAAIPQGDIDPRQVSDMVREFAGRPDDFTKAINSRLKR
jgi:hypothetical protein